MIRNDTEIYNNDMILKITYYIYLDIKFIKLFFYFIVIYVHKSLFNLRYRKKISSPA